MSDESVILDVTIQIEAAGEEEYLAEVTQELKRDILALDVEKVQLKRSESVIKGSKGDAVTWGQLLIAFAASGSVFTTLITLFQAWVTRNERRALILEVEGDKLEITGISADEQQRLIDEWLSRHPTILVAK
jgi:hypothetical protein